MLKGIVKSIMNSKVALLLLITVLIVAFFYCINPGYLGVGNILILLKNISLTGILGIGVGLLLISGQIDLSTSAVAGLSGVFVASLLGFGLPWPLAVLLTLLFGVCAGAITAFFVNKLNMMSFIATIALSSIWQGIAYVITRTGPIKFNNNGFLKISSIAFVSNILPLSFIILVVLMSIYGWILSQTKFGRSVYICGGNKNAARLAGINPKRVHSILFINSGMLASLCGILLASNMGKGDSSPLSQGMVAVTAAILGGIAFTGGAGGLGGVFVGLMLLSFFNSGLAVIRLLSYWQIFAQGMLLILALLFDYYRENRKLKILRAGSANTIAIKK